MFNRVLAKHDDAYLLSKYRYKDAHGRRYRLSDLRSPSPRPNLTYDYKGFKPHPNGWAVSRERMAEMDVAGLLEFPRKLDGRIQYRRYLNEEGAAAGSVWDDIRPVNFMAQERLGYPTQKPLTLLERIVSASCNVGDTILDPFCGCGTAIHAAQKLGRCWIGIDVTHLAMIDAQPYGGKKKGADGGIDGLIYFRSDAKTTERAIVSVKGGVSVPMVRDLVAAD